MTVSHATQVVIQPHTLSFDVFGIPAPQGSKRYVGGGVSIDDNQLALRGWRDDVKQAALRELTATPGWERDYPAIIGHFTFVLARPASHYGSGRNAGVLKASAPALHASKPDLDKLLRSTFDALTSAGAYLDDRRVARVHAVKLYVAPLTPDEYGQAAVALDRPGVRIVLTGVER